MNEILLIIGMFIATFISRYPVLVLVGRIELPKNVFHALKYVPVAVLTAIIAPAMVMPTGSIEISLNNAYLIGGIVGILVSWRTQNLLATIVISLAVFLIWQGIMA